MKAADVPRVLRGSLAETEAYRDGRKAALAGLARERNPWVEDSRKHVVATCGGILRSSEALEHAYVAETRSTLCGKPGAYTSNRHFWPDAPWSCQSCRRGVEAERKRLEQGWNRGYRDGMKERG